MNDHIDAQDLAAYVDGALAGAPRAGLESHLSRCGECRDALAEIVDIRERAERIPGEFLRQALGQKPGPAKARPPLRLVFGVAAVFLVVLALGYHFLDRGRADTAAVAEKKGMPRPPAAVEERRPDAAAAEPEVREEMRRNALPAPESRARAAEKKLAAGQVEPGQPAVPLDESVPASAILSAKAERQLQADEADMAPAREAEGAVGGVFRGGETPLAKDKESAVLAAAAPAAPEARAGELNPIDAGMPGKAAAPGRIQGAALESGMAQGSRALGPGSADALQLFLVVTGRAAAPQAVGAGSWAARPAIRLAGDVSRSDLNDPGLLDAWSWFPAGLSLELAIDDAGAVIAVNPVGPWNARLAARAANAARALRFTASGRKNRRAVLSLPVLPPN